MSSLMEFPGSWKDLEKEGGVVLTLDILANANEDLNSPALWAYL